MNKQKTVFVGLSGGVDSSVAALRLKNQGYHVVGVFIKVWHPDFLECNWEDERLDAMRVAAHLDIPFLMCDAEEAYKTAVADYFIQEYKEGRTPNPDVMCNKAVKFGAFMDFALMCGADYIATGHYAQNTQYQGKHSLLRGNDAEKDQTYFLWTIKQEQLSEILFPVGSSPKSTIRAEAKNATIPVAEKNDSQGICFLGHVDIPDFLSHFITLTPGQVLNKAGNIIGTHRGSLVYTLGQRHGFRIEVIGDDEGPHYITAINHEQNTITVSPDKPGSEAHTPLTLHSINLIEPLTENSIVHAQTRYRQKPVPVRIDAITTNSMTLSFLDGHEIVAAGQSCVLYDSDTCLGGGIIG